MEQAPNQLEVYDKITQIFTTTEAKYVLLCMVLYGMKDVSYEECRRGCGMEIAEVMDAANMLKVVGENVSKDFNRIKLHDRWFPNEARVEIQPEQSGLLQSLHNGVGGTVCSGNSEAETSQSPIEVDNGNRGAA